MGAAADHVLAHGVSGLALRPLGAALGVSHVALLHHFGSREQLFVEVLRELRDREREQLARQAGALTGDAGLEALLRAAWARLSAPAHDRFLRLLFEVVGRALQDPEAYGPFLDELVDDWTGSVEALLLARGAGEEEAAALAVCVYGAVRGLLLDLVSTGRRDRAEAGFEQFVTLLRPRFAALEAAR